MPAATRVYAHDSAPYELAHLLNMGLRSVHSRGECSSRYSIGMAKHLRLDVFLTCCRYNVARTGTAKPGFGMGPEVHSPVYSGDIFSY